MLSVYRAIPAEAMGELVLVWTKQKTETLIMTKKKFYKVERFDDAENPV